MTGQRKAVAGILASLLVIPLFLSFLTAFVVVPETVEAVPAGTPSIVTEPFRNISYMQPLGARAYYDPDNITVSTSFDQWENGAGWSDFSGHDENWVMVGGCSNVSGYKGNGVMLDGTHAYLNSTSYGTYGDPQFGWTVSVWLKPTETGYRTILNKGNLKILYSNSRLYVSCYDSGGNWVNFGAVSATTMTAGVWTHVILSFQDDNQSCYLNGVLKLKETDSWAGGKLQSSTAGWYFGAKETLPYYGIVDEFFALNCPLRSDAEARRIYEDARRTVYAGYNWTYNAVANISVNWTLSSNATFVHLDGTATDSDHINVYGVPQAYQCGDVARPRYYWFNLTATADSADYQNITFYASLPPASPWDGSNGIGINNTRLNWARTGVNLSQPGETLAGINDATVLVFAMWAFGTGGYNPTYAGDNQNFPDGAGAQLDGIETVDELWQAYFDCVSSMTEDKSGNWPLRLVRLGAQDGWGTNQLWNYYNNYTDHFIYILSRMCYWADYYDVKIVLEPIGQCSVTAGGQYFHFMGSGYIYQVNYTEGSAWMGMLRYLRDVCYIVENQTAIVAIDVVNEADGDGLYTAFWEPFDDTDGEWLRWNTALANEMQNFSDVRSFTMGNTGGSFHGWFQDEFNEQAANGVWDIVQQHSYGRADDDYLVDDPSDWCTELNRPYFVGEFGWNMPYPPWTIERRTWHEDKLGENGWDMWTSMTLIGNTSGWPIVTTVNSSSYDDLAVSGLAYSYTPTTNVTVNAWILATNSSATINSGTGTVSWTPDSEDEGTYYLNVSATNACGSDYDNRTLRVWKAHRAPLGSADFYNDGSVANHSAFTRTELYVTPDVNCTVEVTEWNGTHVANFTASATGGSSVLFEIAGLTAGENYTIDVDGVEWTQRDANASGWVNFTYASWSEHIFLVFESPDATPPTPTPDDEPDRRDSWLTAYFEYQSDGLTVGFADASITEYYPVVGWVWNFGDGKASLNENPIHTYERAGTYYVTLQVTNSIGQKDAMTRKVVVESPGAAADETMQNVMSGQSLEFLVGGLMALVLGLLLPTRFEIRGLLMLFGVVLLLSYGYMVTGGFG